MAEHEAISRPSQGLPTKRTKRIATLEPSGSHVNFPWVAGWTGELGRLVVGLPQKLRIAGAVGTPFDALQQSSGPVRQPVLRVRGHRWKVLGPPLGPHWVPLQNEGSPGQLDMILFFGARSPGRVRAFLHDDLLAMTWRDLFCYNTRFS